MKDWDRNLSHALCFVLFNPSVGLTWHDIDGPDSHLGRKSYIIRLTKRKRKIKKKGQSIDLYKYQEHIKKNTSIFADISGTHRARFELFCGGWCFFEQNCYLFLFKLKIYYLSRTKTKEFLLVLCYLNIL